MGKAKTIYRVISPGRYYTRFVIYAFDGDPILSQSDVKFKFKLLDKNFEPTYETELFSMDQLEEVHRN
jgi:hypothetical protein